MEVKSIHFEGNQTFSDGALRNLISTKETPAGMWTFLFKHIGENFPGAAEPKYFDNDIFNEDVQLIKQHYNNNGFFHTIVNGSYVLDSSSKKLMLNSRLLKTNHQILTRFFINIQIGYRTL